MKKPPGHNFPYDTFQIAAIEEIQKEQSVIVSAPTGAGKTVIAEYACFQSMEKSEGIIYTAPVKALSNQKFRDFSEIYGKENTGILTGDVSINPHAPILIMTTEIFRNRLFDPEDLFVNRKWVIFDEIHYIDDLERGTVWEESLIFFPQHMRILALSATIPNIDELADWISSIHKHEVKTIVENNRPVPLSFSFMLENQFFPPSSKELKHILAKKRKKAPQNKISSLIYHLKRENLFPCIYFVFSRKRCEIFAGDCKKFDLITKEQSIELEKEYNKQLELFRLENNRHAEEMRPFLRKGIAFHHAGILPPLKEIIERLFTKKMIALIFTTETFALGINMPSRAVVFDQLRKFYGIDFDYLRTRDFFQMAGRAGRRGFDESGQVISLIGNRGLPHKHLKRMIFGEPEAVQSQFNSNYATILNLYQQLGEQVLKIYPQTLHNFQSGKKQKKQGRLALKNKLSLLKFLGYIDDEGLTARGIFGSHIYGYELQCTDLFMEGFFEDNNEEMILVVIQAMIFEPRPRQIPPRLSKDVRKIKNKADKIVKGIRKVEIMFKSEGSPCKLFFFHLSEAMRAWSRGVDFDEMVKYTDIDEGEIIRNFRMTLQIIREMQRIEGCSDAFYEKMKNCVSLIKRDIIDPEAQFEMG